MASFFPETPYCVISEKTLRNSDKSPFNLSSNLYNSHLDEINREYQEKQYNYLIDKYLDIDCDDDVLFMSPSGDRDIDSKFSFKNFPGLIEKRFALLKPIDSCEVTIKASNPGDYFFSRIPVEDLYEFNFSSHPKKKFNKIIVKNCLPFFDKHQAYFCEFLSSLLKNTLPYVPCILLIQRVNNLSTLPFHQSVCSLLALQFEFIKLNFLIFSMCRFTMIGPNQTPSILNLLKRSRQNAFQFVSISRHLSAI